MSGTKVIINKELKRVFGDRKLIFSLFILPAVIVIGLYALMGKLIAGMESDIQEHVSTVTFVDAPDEFRAVADALEYSDVAEAEYISSSDFASKKDDIEAQILEGDYDMVVEFDPGFMDKYSVYENVGDEIPSITVKYNSTENYSQAAYTRLSSMLLPAFQNELVGSRIGNMEILTVFNQEDVEIVKEEKVNTEFVSMMLPYLIVMMLFAGAMSIGVDAIAGEKERGTLASMLLTPVSRSEIVFGKLVSMALLSGLSSLIYSGSMIIAMPLMGDSMASVGESGFGGVSFGAVQIIELVLIMFAMDYLYVAVIGFLSAIAKDTKVASTYISPVYIVVIVLGVLTMVSMGKDVPTARYLIPVYGNALAIKDLCGNELSVLNFCTSLGGTILLSIVLTFAIARVFKSEKIMFNA